MKISRIFPLLSSSNLEFARLLSLLPLPLGKLNKEKHIAFLPSVLLILSTILQSTKLTETDSDSL